MESSCFTDIYKNDNSIPYYSLQFHYNSIKNWLWIRNHDHDTATVIRPKNTKYIECPVWNIRPKEDEVISGKTRNDSLLFLVHKFLSAMLPWIYYITDVLLWFNGLKWNYEFIIMSYLPFRLSRWQQRYVSLPQCQSDSR